MKILLKTIIFFFMLLEQMAIGSLIAECDSRQFYTRYKDEWDDWQKNQVTKVREAVAQIEDNITFFTPSLDVLKQSARLVPSRPLYAKLLMQKVFDASTVVKNAAKKTFANILRENSLENRLKKYNETIDYIKGSNNELFLEVLNEQWCAFPLSFFAQQDNYLIKKPVGWGAQNNHYVLKEMQSCNQNEMADAPLDVLQEAAQNLIETSDEYVRSYFIFSHKLSFGTSTAFIYIKLPNIEEVNQKIEDQNQCIKAGKPSLYSLNYLTALKNCIKKIS